MRFWKKRQPAEIEEWAVVQDLHPFGYRIESVHPSQAKAMKELNSRRSRYLTVEPLAFVKAENERLVNMDEFDKELIKHIDQAWFDGREA